MKELRVSSFNYDNSENVAYDDPLFPAYIRRGMFSRIPEYCAVLHWHEDLEFVVILSGGIVYYVDGEEIELNASDAIFVNSRHMHNSFASAAPDCEFICVLLHPQLLCANSDFADRFVQPLIRNPQRPYLVLRDEILWQREVIKLVKLIAENQNSTMAQTVIQRSFFHIFELMYANAATDGDKGEAAEPACLNALKKMVFYIQEHFTEPITLDELARAVPCSKSKCIKLFHAYLKEPPITYLIKYRLNQSCERLRNSDVSVTEIAFTCGFNNASYFCEAFKKHYGMSPLAYRREINSACDMPQNAGAVAFRTDRKEKQ